jgi:hypothetical protein
MRELAHSGKIDGMITCIIMLSLAMHYRGVNVIRVKFQCIYVIT